MCPGHGGFKDDSMRQAKAVCLARYNSFGIAATARGVTQIDSLEDLSELRFNPGNDLVLGGGSNLLFAADLAGTVFLNRLKKGNRLESDPTVIYGIKDFNGNLTREDLLCPTPYNTYVIRGLPPGAIANPGEEALKAVLQPAETAYMYFVSKNDGTHYFSKTLSEHNNAVRIYQKNRRCRQRAKSGK